NGCAAPRRAPALSANGYQGTKTRSIPKESELSAGSFLVGRRLLQGGQRRERMAALVIAFRRIEDGAGLARIGIDGEQEELGRGRTDVDDTVDEIFRFIGGFRVNFFVRLRL